jgi:uncharacterized protein (TIGR02145 family)
MKTLIITTFMILSIMNLHAQPQAFSYSALIKNKEGKPVIKHSVTLRIGIIQGKVDGSPEYMELHKVTTSESGTINIEIGHGKPQMGEFSQINWGKGPYFLKSEIDLKGGENYQLLGVSELLSVPYALYSGESANGFSGNYEDLQNKPLIPDKLSQLANDAGFINLETDPSFLKSVAGGITKADIDKWNTNHDFEGDMKNHKITNLLDPTFPYDAATMAYVDRVRDQIVEYIQGVLGQVVEVVYDSIYDIQDIDGNNYHTVKIGTQNWMAENLKTTKYNDGTSIVYNPFMDDNQVPSYTFRTFGNLKQIYGCYYNWYIVSNNKLCPQGWHVPSDSEWTTLEIYLQNNNYNYNGIIDTDNDRNTNNFIAKALASTYDWAPVSYPYVGTPGSTDYGPFRNKSGFSALPAGTGYGNQGFHGWPNFGDWWTSTENSAQSASDRHLNNGTVSMDKGDSPKKLFESVRCLQDNSQPNP